MKKVFGLFAALVVVAALAVGLAGCGSDDDNGNGNGTATGGATTSALVGTWDWLGIPYYVFNADGTGTMFDSPIRWTASNGVVSMCITPDTCGDTCADPNAWAWYYEISGNQLTITSTLTEDLTFTYTRG